MRFAALRGALMSQMEEGGMAAVFAPADRVAVEVEAINAASSDVGLSISGYNGTHQVVSGPIARIEAISKRFEQEGIRVRRLNTAKAFHSALVEPILYELEASLNDVAIQPPALTVVSNLTGRAVEPDQAQDGAYWRRHAREPVAFAQGVKTLADLGVDVVLEIGPAIRAGSNGGLRLASVAADTGTSSAVEPLPAISVRKRRRFRGSGRRSVSGGTPNSFCGTLRRGDAAADLPAQLPIPAQTPLA